MGDFLHLGAEAVPGLGDWGTKLFVGSHRPITGAKIYLSQKPKPDPLDPLGPLAEVDFLSGFRAPRDGSGPRGTDQGPAGSTRALQNEPGPREMDQGLA